MKRHILCVLALIGLCALLARPVQADPGDSLAVKEIPPPFIENKEKRIAMKMAAGTFMSAVSAAIISGELIRRRDPTPNDTYAGLSAAITGVYYGCLFGFPIGVTAVDLQDSFFKTLLGSITGRMVGVGLREFGKKRGYKTLVHLGLPVLFVGPMFGSIIASEIWRKPPQDRRISFGLAPNLKGGISAVATLRF